MNKILLMFYIILLGSNMSFAASKDIIGAGNKDYINYTVEKGDTLGEIAVRYEQDLGVLSYNNPQIGKYLNIGEKLLISKENFIVYRVKKGDTLSGIENKFQIKADQVKIDNKLKSDKIYLSQELIIKDPRINLSNDRRKNNNSMQEINIYWPVEWKGVTSPYGRRLHPILKKYLGHGAVDLRANYVPVKAAENGVVTYAGWMKGYGNLVIIKHLNGYETRYAHLNKIEVKNGQSVKSEQLIAESGETGNVTAPHLHFEIRKNGIPTNPMNYFK
ncbi:M23 family metallopeptidase [Fusobacteria bacterium ZRK30]|nr:M23 family metallopeptidase [Fusobacteria bacterium ZRK30]